MFSLWVTLFRRGLFGTIGDFKKWLVNRQKAHVNIWSKADICAVLLWLDLWRNIYTASHRHRYIPLYPLPLFTLAILVCWNSKRNDWGQSKQISAQWSLLLLDVDECLKNPCNNAICNNEPGGYSCICKSGWQGESCSQGNWAGIFKYACIIWRRKLLILLHG